MVVKTITASATKVGNASNALALPFAVLLIAGALAGAALAASPHAEEVGAARGHGGALGFAKPAPGAEARRTVEVTMRDNAFEPERIQVEAGETVRFVVTNEGQLVHEFNIGTPAMHAQHQRQI